MKKRFWWIGGGIGLALAIAIISVVVLNPATGKEAFYGEHQSGITTASQKFAFVAAFDLKIGDPGELRQLFKDWTIAFAALTEGQPLAPPAPASVSPHDTGETIGYKPARLTMTLGVGPSLFDQRFGLAAKRPAALQNLPAFNGDRLNPEWSDGDLVVQVAADDYQTAYHAIHVLTKMAKGKAVLRWVQDGFQSGLEVNPHGPGRNLEGFKDGTINPDTSQADQMNAIVWVGPEGGWLKGGSYLVVRKIRMFVEVWDRSALADQERTIGRERESGKEVARPDPNSHVAVARGDGSVKLLRRPFHYVNGLDGRTGQWDAGLLFLAWMKDPQKQFVPMQTRLSDLDLLNEYIQPVGSAVFAVLPGIKPGDYLGSTLLPEPPLTQGVEALQASIGAIFPAISQGDWAKTRQGLGDWKRQWEALRPAAGQRAVGIDSLAAQWQASLDAQQPDASLVRQSAARLVTALSDWGRSISPKAENSATSLEKLKLVLADLDGALGKADLTQAKILAGNFQKEWMAREALMRNLNSAVYAEMELQGGALRRALQGQDQGPAAQAAVQKMRTGLSSLNTASGFGPLDISFLLFREGLEALLVLAALLAFLGKTNQKRNIPWVWSGAVTGIITSAIIAVAVSAVLSGWLASTAPELVEGITGLVAVVLMLTVGIWLHGKARIKDWNQWLKQRLGRAGNGPWAFAALAFVAVLREGAETVVFFWGVAPGMSALDLLVGIGLGLAVLIVLGVLLLAFSRRLPLQWFFPLATGMIYFLAVKITGQSLGALQAIGLMPATPLGFGGPIDILGFQPTWETALPQLVLLLGLGAALAISVLRKPLPPAGKPAA